MEDRELLELAAKAAGVKIDKSNHNGGGYGNNGFDIAGNAVLDWHNGVKWNPLTDDGDALRLAVKLKLDIAIDDYVQVSWWSEPGSLQWVNEECCRRAIVRAAAEIGRKMP